MALVMLPCDLPWWPQLQRLLITLQSSTSTKELLDGMTKIHDMCNISLDPDEDEKNAVSLFEGLALFLDTCLDDKGRTKFMNHTLRCMVQRALDLKTWRPPRGLHFSLQQQSDCNELSHNLLSSLLAHAFFSTYPKRTNKTHPTLQDFNFTHFFTHLDSNIQQAKLRSILQYFEWIENNNNTQGSVKISRQVMSSRQWLTIEDWLECSLPLCPLRIKHDGRLNRADPETLHVCFSNASVGGAVLQGGISQECLQFCSMPELLCMLLSCEALEDNEAILIEGARKTSRLDHQKNRPTWETMQDPQEISVCCMDPEDYSKLPVSQFEEDNVLRELNKCLLAFRQKPSVCEPTESKNLEQDRCPLRSRLSPIGESVSSTPPDVEATVIIQKPSRPATKSPTPNEGTNPIDRKRWLSPSENTPKNRRGRFILLGSSGECLPVNRRVSALSAESQSKTFPDEDSSSDEEFHSARTSLDEAESGDEAQARRYSLELDTPARRSTFAARLREALHRESDGCSSSTADDSDEEASGYAVGISVAGSGLGDGDIRVRRGGGSVGFMLTAERGGGSGESEESFNEPIVTKRAPLLHRHDTSESSRYSFSTEYSSELEEVYEQFSRWLDDPILGANSPRELDARDLAVVRFAGSLLKRTLSESFAGVPLTEGCVASSGIAAEDSSIRNYNKRKNQIAITARSLSLELARHKHRLAAQLTETDENENLTDENEDKQSILSFGTSSVPSDSSVETIIRCIEKSSDKKSQNKRKVKWAVSVIEAVEQTLASENVVLKLPKSKISELANKREDKNGLKAVSTGNWGCGNSHAGDPQLKLIIQWLAASVAGVPSLIYYTNGHEQLAKLDTLCRVLVDRKWTVGELTSETLGYSQGILIRNQTKSGGQTKTLFETLISGV